MRKLAAAVALILILAASLPAGATYGTVFVRDWRNMAACQCLTDVWFVAPGAYARLSPDGEMMAYKVIDAQLREKLGTEAYVGDSGLFIGSRDRLMGKTSFLKASSSAGDLPVYWAFPSAGYRWSRDGRHIYYEVIVDPTFNDVFWETWRLDLITGDTQKLPWVGRVVVDTSPDGRWVVTIQTYSDGRREEVPPYVLRERDVIVVDMVTGREVVLVRRGMIRVGLINFTASFNEQGNRLAIPVRNEIRLYNFDGTNYTHYKTLTFDGLVGGAVWDPHGDYLIVQMDTAYLPASRFHQPQQKSELYWVDLRTDKWGPIWPSNFTQEAPWFVPGTRTLAFNSQIGDTLQALPLYLMNSGESLPPTPYTASELALLR